MAVKIISRENAERILKTELGVAVEAHNRATVESWRLHLGPQGADENELRAAAARQALAKNALILALGRFNRLRSGSSVAGLKITDDARSSNFGLIQ